MLGLNQPLLINILGHAAGALIFAIFLVLLYSGRGWSGMRGRYLSGLAAGLSLTWNLGSLVVLAWPALPAPVLDMVRYERYGLGAQWRAEYGSAAIPGQLDWLLSYSPYHRVGPGRRYPPTLLVTFGGDTRVAAMHARKMCAALQHADVGGGPVLLHDVEGVGHGAKPSRRGAQVAATVLGFLARHTGLIPTHPVSPRICPAIRRA